MRVAQAALGRIRDDDLLPQLLDEMIVPTLAQHNQRRGVGDHPVNRTSSNSATSSSRVYCNAETRNRAKASRNPARVTPAISAAFAWEMRSVSYHLTAAASRISSTNPAGFCLKAEKVESGSSMETVAWSASQEEKVGAHPFLQSRISASLRRLPFQRQRIPLLDV